MIGDGALAAWISFLFGGLCVLGTLAFLFPTWLTTAQLREAYDLPLLRYLMIAGLIIASGAGLFALVKQKHRRIASAGLLLVAVCFLLGGPGVTPGPVHDSPISIGIDWFVLGLLSTGIVFITLEKLAPLRKDQPVLREKWTLDMRHFLFYHLTISIFLFTGNAVAHQLFGWLIVPGVGAFVRDLPFVAQFALILLVVDLAQYWVHRLYHEHQRLWKVHAVHHSAEQMDWLASSRLHILEPLVTRTVGLVVLTTFGFDQGPLNAYILFVGFHATFIHANCGINFGWLENIIVFPRHHHWHHAHEKAAINKNYAVHLAFLDRLFGTWYLPVGWPRGYGVFGAAPEASLAGHMVHPFRQPAE